jgi:hypothetical protein
VSAAHEAERSSPTDPPRWPEDDEDSDGPLLRLVPSHRNDVDDDTVRLAIKIIKKAGVVTQLSAWKDAERRGPGGRPEKFPLEALLVGVTICVLTNQPLHFNRLTEIMFRQLSAEWREQLGIPVPPSEGDEKGWKAAYRTVRTRFHSMLDLVDPSAMPKNRRLDDATFNRLTAQRQAQLTDAEWVERSERLVWLINQLIEGSIQATLPREVRRKFNGSIAIDGTLIKSHSRPFKRRPGTRAKRGKRAEIAIHSADPDAGYYIRPADSRDKDAGSLSRDKIDWGFDATFAVSGSADPKEGQLFPNLILAMSVLSKPGYSPGKQATQVLSSLSARGYEAGLLAVDRAFSSAKEEDFQLPALALGYRMICDYKDDQLGVQAEYSGFLQIEGGWYSPSIPLPLINATIDYRKHLIDEDTYKARLQERWNYLARPKARPDDEGHVRLQCPAAGSWPTVRCPLKPSSTTRDNRGRLHIVVEPALKANPPSSCTQQSVTVPPEAGAKFRQELLYGGPEWSDAYHSLRNTNEGMNGYVKDPAHEALDDPGRRRIHGIAAQSVLVAFLVMAANVRKIRTFGSLRPRAPGQKRPRRRGTKPVTAWRPPPPRTVRSADPDPPLTA